jgi:hypothetical protein
LQIALPDPRLTKFAQKPLADRIASPYLTLWSNPEALGYTGPQKRIEYPLLSSKEHRDRQELLTIQSERR